MLDRKGPMTIQRWLVTAAALTMVGVSLRAQTPAFEVASVKRLEEPPRNDIALFKPPIIGAIVNYRAVTVVGLIQAAYDVRDFQVVGAPEWAMKDWFEVQARAAGQPSANEMRVMLRSLLADRFGLAGRYPTLPP
jgi:uncharacterized protein (TIGR03435 family)